MGHIQVEPVHCQKQHSKASKHAHNTHGSGDSDDLSHIPTNRAFFQTSVIVGDGHDWYIVQEGKEYDHYCSNWIKVEEDHGQDHEEHNPYCLRDTVDGIGVHPLKYTPCLFYGPDNDREPRCGKHQICCGTGRICCPADSNSNVCLLECWCIIDPVTSHACNVVSGLEYLHNGELVFWKNLSKPVCLFYPFTYV